MQEYLTNVIAPDMDRMMYYYYELFVAAFHQNVQSLPPSAAHTQQFETETTTMNDTPLLESKMNETNVNTITNVQSNEKEPQSDAKRVLSKNTKFENDEQNMGSPKRKEQDKKQQ